MLQIRRWLKRVIANEIIKNLHIRVYVSGLHSGGQYEQGDLQTVEVEVEVWYKNILVSQEKDET